MSLFVCMTEGLIKLDTANKKIFSFHVGVITDTIIAKLKTMDKQMCLN